MLWGNAVLQQYWQPGQIVDIRLSDRGVEGEFLIQRVTITPTWSNPSIWTFRVDYGGRLLGIADFLKALVSAQQKKRVIEPTKNVQKYIYGEETLTVGDELITATRGLPFVCGDADAVCGMVVVDKGKIIIGWQEEIAQTSARDSDPLSSQQELIGQDFEATPAMEGVQLLRAYVYLEGTPSDTKWYIYSFSDGKPGMPICEPVILTADDWGGRAWVDIRLLEPLQAGVRYCLVGQGFPAPGQTGNTYWQYNYPHYSIGAQHCSYDGGVSWESYPGFCCTFKIAIPIYG